MQATSFSSQKDDDFSVFGTSCHIVWNLILLTPSLSIPLLSVRLYKRERVPAINACINNVVNTVLNIYMTLYHPHSLCHSFLSDALNFIKSDSRIFHLQHCCTHLSLVSIQFLYLTSTQSYLTSNIYKQLHIICTFISELNNAKWSWGKTIIREDLLDLNHGCQGFLSLLAVSWGLYPVSLPSKYNFSTLQSWPAKSGFFK